MKTGKNKIYTVISLRITFQSVNSLHLIQEVSFYDSCLEAGNNLLPDHLMTTVAVKRTLLWHRHYGNARGNR